MQSYHILSQKLYRKDYIAFEQGINPMIAEKMIAEKSRDYMNARRVAKEYEAMTRGLDRSFLSLPPCGSLEEMKQVEIWQKYIAWERSNPLRIEDQVLLNKRVMFAFEQSLLCLGHFPNIWHAAASHLQDCGRILTEKGVHSGYRTQWAKMPKKSTLNNAFVPSKVQIHPTW